MPANLTLVLANFTLNETVAKSKPIWPTLLKHITAKLDSRQNFQLLGKLFNLDWQEDGAIAPVLALADGLNVTNDWWLCADPVEMRADATQVYLLGNDHLALSDLEIEQLRLEITSLLQGENLQLIAVNSRRWYIRLNNNPEISTHALSEVKGKNLYPFFPQGPKADYWRKLMTEIQMLLYNSPVNSQRVAQGLPPINSLWFWGQGQLPHVNSLPKWHQVWSNNVLTQGLAKLTKINFSPIKSSFLECKARMLSEGNYLIVLDVQKLTAYEEEWLEPIVQALRDSTLERLTIYYDNGEINLTRKQLLPWWQRLTRWN